ncbi:YdeI/OmpD-associated family protein [Aureimonas phyllosphaerae]|uniref:Uncharacterized protein YdeI (YjbR/CyaY-like superfamily) n=1 Tax=Aureimonas phyllosphaerae TaxID=1166078 RepID=A0A7W6BX82_9HYPH|nr:YdeI/OmpD-associated family protein [Aureimonas phyllosphaerae]MBB3935396.1 uncharacterized protein YdeI (YjbR/CyaY-like superfamily) [Aureimonas phyllosphaerae]MBB3959404.1 uncharacterized protein YdeI (YjbR/CyaY-like superfamily) [Aureimonas phyllosphaerae]SFF03483.1 Uncharacterized conserved protein YdeI, YjbR/CyaY-like superfamily, DUF1801 family [Aureimonas phyllosphaerae]
MAPIVVDPARIHAFASAAEFERWLGVHHAIESEIWIRIFKKAGGYATVSPAEAIDVCLCWGWIDAIRKAHDEISYLQRYTPRRPRSIWSLVNVGNVERFAAAGRMTERGLRHVETAKRDGRWDRAYAGSRDMVMPDDLSAAVAADPAAQATFQALSAQNRFALAFRLHNIRRPAARRRRIDAFVLMLREGRMPHSQKRSPKSEA